MLEITTLGNIDLRANEPAPRNGGGAALLGQTKPLAVFLYLATNGRARCPRNHLAELFWPDRDEARARNALSKTLGRIRAALGEAVLVSGPQDVGVAADTIRTDLAAFDAAATRGDAATALGLYGGDFLPDLSLPDATAFEQWQDGMRTRLRSRAAALARQHARQLVKDGASSAAIATLERAVAWQPVDESLSCDLIALYARAGDVTHALREYQRLELALVDQLGTSPAAATRALAERVRARRPVTPTVDLSAPAGAAALEAPNSAWPRALAVLPFANLSGDAEQDYFADGMTEALITELARHSAFRVISRQSVLGFRDSRQSLQEIARALDVDAVIEGSVLRDQDRVRITAQLVRVEPEAHLWAGTFDQTLSSVLALHADTARGIVEAIDRAAANPGNQRTAGIRHSGLVAPVHHAEPRSVDPVAYEAYLKGRHFSLRLPQTDRAIAHYRIAIERDPLYAPAWAGLAAAYASLAVFAYLSPADAFPQLSRALEQALALDKTLGEAIAVRGMYRMLADRDWAGARQDFARAVERSPDSLDARIDYVFFLAAMGEFDAALAQQRQAATLDPIGPITRFMLAWSQYKAGQHHASNRELETILELHPHFALAHPYAAVNHALLGDAAAAADAARQGIQSLPYDHEALALAAAAFGRIGAAQEGQEALERLLAIGSHRYLDPWAVGIAYAGLGDFDAAALWFRRMYDERSPSAFCIRHDPLLEPLRAHPVFREVERRLAFPAPIR
ncbi:MAG: BTAD domain-containing putative transcriptional regulator [Longimicrobiales bacterium]